MVVGITVAAGHALSRSSEQGVSGTARQSSQASGGTFPGDIYPETGNCFPAIKREYVWTADEPAAQKAGLEQQIIDTVKYRRPLTTLGEKEALIVQLRRDSIGKHKVGSETFARAVKLFWKSGSRQHCFPDVVSLMGDYAATTILLNVADQHVRPRDRSLLPIP